MGFGAVGDVVLWFHGEYALTYVTARNKLENNIQLINIPFVLNVLLYGDEGESYETNSLVFQQVKLFIKETEHFINYILKSYQDCKYVTFPPFFIFFLFFLLSQSITFFLVTDVILKDKAKAT